MNDAPNREFYVGYLEKAPPGLARHMQRSVVRVLIIAVVLCALLVLGQHPLGTSTFEFGTYREFQGIIRENPYPMLEVARPGRGDLPSGYSRYHLVLTGKHGAGPEVAGHDGKLAKLQGSLIYRDDQTMIELVKGTVELMNQRAGLRPEISESLGTFVLQGEIVDSKCYLGVMNPAERKPHKSCAIRCISGGIPPILLVRSDEGWPGYFLLESFEGRSVNESVLELVAEPVEIEGEVFREDDLLVLRADPRTYRPLR